MEGRGLKTCDLVLGELTAAANGRSEGQEDKQAIAEETESKSSVEHTGKMSF